MKVCEIEAVVLALAVSDAVADINSDSDTETVRDGWDEYVTVCDNDSEDVCDDDFAALIVRDTDIEDDGEDGASL